MLQANFKQILVNNTPLLHDINIEIHSGKVTTILGPNGSGKSTIAKTILGFPHIKAEGKVEMDGINITNLPLHKRVQEGIYLSHQSPSGISGIRLSSFLRTAYLQMNYIDPKLDLLSFRKEMVVQMKTLGLKQDILDRELHVGFSGGEMKKIEFLQLILFKPKYAILDEIDSGLDITARKVIFEIIKQLSIEGMGFCIITHRENIANELPIDKQYNLGGGTITHE